MCHNNKKFTVNYIALKKLLLVIIALVGIAISKANSIVNPGVRLL